MVAQVVSGTSKLRDIAFSLIEKVKSVPGTAVAAVTGLLLGMCLYYGALETYAPITNLYHTLLSNDYWRHLTVRAAPQALFAAWFAQCVAVISVVNGRIKPYRVFRTHEIFWRPFVGVLAALPGAAIMAVAIWFFHWTQYLTVAATSHPGVSDQLAQSVALDGDKKIIALVGALSAVWYMKPYFLNVQGWLAENRIIAADAKNAARREVGTTKMVPYTRFYHHLFPGLVARTRFLADNLNEYVSTTKGKRVFMTLNRQNHQPIHRAIYKAFNVVIAAGILGGLYIMLMIAQNQYLAIHVVH